MGLIRSIKRNMMQLYVKQYLGGGGGLPMGQDQQPVWSEWDDENAVQNGFKASSWVYKSIDKRAKAAASVPWKVYRLKNETWEEVPGHPLAALIENPNPFMDRTVFMERMTQHLLLGGNSLHHKVRGYNGKSVLELWPFMPQHIKPVKSSTDFIKHYRYENGNIKKEFKTDDIIHVMQVDPGNLYWGMGNLQVAAKTVDTDVEAVNWNKIALQNRAVPDGALVSKEPLSRPQWEEAREQLRIQKQGANNARDMWLLGGGMQFQQFSLSPAEMDFINSRKMTREEICSVFDVPPILLGILENSTYANYQEARKAFWEDAVIPFLDRLKAALNQSLIPDFQAQGEVIYLDYDLSNIPAMQQKEKERAEVAKHYFTMGVPFNVINRRFDLGFDDIEGGDNGYLPSGLVPSNLDFEALAAEAEAPRGEPPEKNEEPANALKTVEGEIRSVNLRTDEEKAMYWKNSERRRLAWYANMTKQSAQRFKAEGKDIARAYEKGGSKGALRAIEGDKNFKAWEAIFLRNYRGIVSEFGTSTFENLKKHYQPIEKKADWTDFTFDPYDKLIQDYLTEYAGLKITYMSIFSKKVIGDLITKMEKDGATVDSIAKSILEKYDDMSKHRAFRIARTEMSAGSNYGIYMAGKQTGFKLKKEWINSADSRVRDHHNFYDAVDIDDKFQNGLLYPGDMANGSGSDTIHCRCSMSYIQE